MLKKSFTVTLMLFSFFLFSQQTKAIYGIVFSKKDRKPLDGASIEIVIPEAKKNDILETEPAFTNEKGLFNMTLPVWVRQIIISLPGYKNATLSLKKDKQYYAVYLTKDQTVEIGEVVVNGYQKISRERATGSYVNIDLKTFKQQRTATNLIDLLKGQVPELLFLDNDNPNTLSLRGQSSFFNNESFPLVILDGFELNALSVKSSIISKDGKAAFTNVYQMLEKINIDNIESVNILKDAAAASIWGARAANGVIVITTKKGRTSAPSFFNYNSSFSFQPATDYHYYRKKKGSIDDEIEIARLNVENNLRVNRYSSYYDTSANPAAVQAFLDRKEGLITQAECDRIINQLRGQDALSEYRRLFLRNASTQNHNLSLQQGGDNYSYYASFGYLREEEGIKDNHNERYNAMLNFSSQPFKGVNFSGRINFSREKSQSHSLDSFDRINSYDKILDNQGDYIDQPLYVPQTQKDYEQSGVPYPYDFVYNIKRDFDKSHNTNQSLNVDLGAKLEIDLLKGLKGTLQYQFQKANVQLEQLNQEGYSGLDAIINKSAIFVDDDGDPSTPRVFDPGKGYNGFALPKGDQYLSNIISSSSSGMNVLMNYNRYLTQNQAHYLNILLGVSFNEKNYAAGPEQKFYGYDPRTLRASKQFRNFRDKYGDEIDYEDNMSKYQKKERYLSDYININYTYQNKYVLTGSARLDDSNLFGSSKKYRNIPLWSAGAKWIMKKENFIQSIQFINLLNLKATYGSRGKVDKSSSPYLTLNAPNTDSYIGIPTSLIRHPENTELRWEKKTTANVGLDFQLFNHRLGGSIEFYRDYSSDILYNTPINPTYGYTLQKLNYAAISNRGFEFKGYYTLSLSRDLDYRIAGGLTYNKNKVERVIQNNTVRDLLNNRTYYQGRPLSALWAYQYAGLSAEGKPQIYDAGGKIIDPSTDMNDITGLKYAGQTTPKYFGNFSHTLSYKGISFSALFSYQLGYVFRRTSLDYNSLFSTNTNLPHVDWQRRWKKPGDEAFTQVPAFLPKEVYNNNYTNYYTQSTTLIEKGDHIRWESISLNYTVNKKWLKNTFIKKLQCGVDIQNLGVIYAANSYHEDPLLLQRTNPIKPKPIYSLKVYVNF